tara:strand:+ start:272 stop:769 length:498 start_codon:yes stop_codon:yes gene_type:complete
MIIEIKFIIITLIICISQLVQLAIISFFFKKIDPKINFLITSVSCYLLVIYFGFYFFKIKGIFVLASILLLTSSIIINFTIWSILIWGFTVSLLESVMSKKKITKPKWIEIYTGNKSLDFFTQDRIKLLLIIKSIEKKKNDIQINSIGLTVSKIYMILKKYFFYV